MRTSEKLSRPQPTDFRSGINNSYWKAVFKYPRRKIQPLEPIKSKMDGMVRVGQNNEQKGA